MTISLILILLCLNKIYKHLKHVISNKSIKKSTSSATFTHNTCCDRIRAIRHNESDASESDSVAFSHSEPAHKTNLLFAYQTRAP